MNRNKYGILLRYAVLPLIAVTLFSACGGGGGGGSSPSPLPAAPTNLTAAAISTTQIGLAWTDTANNETEFSIEQSNNSLFTGPTTSVVVTANTTFYTSTGLAPSATFYFRVRAKNTAGYSGYSNTVNAATFTVSTVVGTPTTTASLSGSVDSIAGPGSDARFNYPRGITITSTGTIYVADTMNHTIRQVTLSGSVVTLAGTALASGSTDATGPAARFNQPSGIATDDASLYVADTLNHTIRQINISSGDVTTLAGTAMSAGSDNGTGSAARFNQPSGIAVSGTDLYVADTMNHTIRKISGGTVTTIAGSALVSGSTDSMGTAARFNQPSGIAVDSSGNLYVADTMNHTIRQILISSGTVTVTTLAGSAGQSGSDNGVGSAARFNQPSGISTDDTYLYVTDSGNHTIRKIEISSRNVITLAGQAGVPGASSGAGASATFNHPIGIAIRSTSLYVADTNNHAIRVLDTTGASVTPLAGYVAGTVSTPLSHPFGVTTDGAKLYVADSDHHQIKQIVISSGSLTTIAGFGAFGYSDGVGTAAYFKRPQGITMGDADTLYVADTQSNTIRSIVISTATVSTLAGNGTAPHGTDNSSDGSGLTARFYNPTGIAVLGNYLYVTDSYNNTIRQVDRLTGNTIKLAGGNYVNDTVDDHGSTDGPGTTARFYHPFGVTTDGNALYVTDSVNHTIRKLVTSGTGTCIVSTFAGAAGIAGSSDGIGTAARFNNPTGITTDGTYLYVADNVNSTIRKVEIATGAVTTLAGLAGDVGFNDTTGSAARFNRPFGVVWDDTTNSLYVADTNNNSIRKIQ